MLGSRRRTLSLALPGGRRPDRLPRDRNITGEGFLYMSHYAFNEGAIVARRSFVSTFSGPLCQGAVRASVAKAVDPIRRDLAARLALEAAKLTRKAQARGTHGRLLHAWWCGGIGAQYTPPKAALEARGPSAADSDPKQR